MANKKIKKQSTRMDKDLLFNYLLNGATYSDYKQALENKEDSVDNMRPPTRDEVLEAWILGKDEMGDQYKCGGRMKQEGGNTMQNVQQSLGLIQMFDTAGSNIFEGIATAGGNSDPYSKYILGDSNRGFWGRMLNQNDDLQAGIDQINSNVQNFGIGDNAYLASQYGQINPLQRSTMDTTGADVAKWIVDPGRFLSAGYSAKNSQDRINAAVDAVNARNLQNFDTAVTNSQKMNIWNQMSQPNTAACGGKMKRYDNGGYVNSHFDYLENPLIEVNAGGTHQENPNDGVQTSVAPDGQPNLVEEGETIKEFADGCYVFSDRIVADAEILKNHLLNEKWAGKTYADISKELDKIIEEHKTDEISKRTFEEMTKRLQESQEDQKFQEKQKEVEQFIDSLSDEQKEALEEEMVAEAEQEAEVQAQEEQATQEQAVQEQVAEQQPTPEEQAAMEEQVAMQAQEMPQQTYSPYDQVMSRAQITDAANHGLFGRGGHMHQDQISWLRRNYVDNYGMRRDANTGNLLFDPLVRQPIVSEDEYTREMAREANDNYIQANLLGLDLGTAFNAANLAAKSSEAASALNKASTASKTFSKEADKAIKSFITKGNKGTSPQRLIQMSGNQAQKAADLRNTAGNIFDLYTTARQASNATAGMNAAVSPVLMTSGIYRNVPEQDSVVVNNQPILHNEQYSMPFYNPYDALENVNNHSDNTEDLYIRDSNENIIGEIIDDNGRTIMTRPDISILGNYRNQQSATSKQESNPVKVSSGKSGGQKVGNTVTTQQRTPVEMIPELTPIGFEPREEYSNIEHNDVDPVTGLPTPPTDKELKKAGWKKNKDGEWTNKQGEKFDYFTWLRYAPAIGSGLQTLSDALGITNKNDYTNPNMFQRSINSIPNVGFIPLGGYRTPNYLDTLTASNIMRSSNEAARRAAINNSSGNASAALAALDAINQQENNTLGDFYIKAQQYNNQMEKEVALYNLRINQINASMSMSVQEKNQAIAAEKARLNYNLAQMRQTIEDQNDIARAANYNNLMTNLGNIGRENYIMNQVNNNLAYYYKDNGDGTYSYKRGLDADEKKAAERYAKENGLTIK